MRLPDKPRLVGVDWWQSLVLFDNTYGVAPYPQPNPCPAGEGR
ncbi:hypothetical protein XACW160_750066 [Xanthomonas citri pv. citri]|uniref:Uncharacterized protein n=1 Tax=Xanthomonas citri pv. citri TaxID=611301 RepID=A0A0U5FJB9_XANCI|nr:hypothetical protein XAC902_1070065 [Xanthomonas citri pv. citri]CEJ48312.1 hypothetical protein XAB3213_4140045 [Xanthomonas citri pv. bilvae]CEE39859.1 hypothetical protein XAC3824_920066 [Xanthomonas citri pv. citri]CEE39919.1 hypothetical protein XAC9322_740067 [Xanthomonas citri pv. citri]CEE41370.1 hypothetical protein XAC1083_770046 [Xanthomonas citri pv. citri]